MRKIEQQSQGIHYQSVSLFREDLDEIINLLSQETKSVEISDSEYVYESLDELKSKRGTKPKTLRINSHEPFISLEFKNDIFFPIWLYRGDSGKDSLFLFRSIEDILSKRKRLIFKIINPTVGIILFAILFIGAIFFSEFIKEILPETWQRIVFILITLGIPILSILGKTGSFYSMSLLEKNNNIGFFKRQKDDLLKILLGAIIGGIITYIVTIIS